MNAKNDESEYLTLDQASKFLQFSQPTFCNWGKNGTLKDFRAGVHKFV